MISHRQITSEEYRFAVAVFGNTLPPMDKLYLTNLSHGGGRAYTWPNLDHSVVLNPDKAFENLMAITNGSYPTRGQLSFMRWRMHGKFRRSPSHPACSARSFFRLAYMILDPPAKHGAAMD